ncbi:hypothetical protein C8J57DRAFT_1541525 [Mycena rebaudengoi]|nr:hypothetical protein C8J57DRAFT_1541525 [Mycena rebaudengoi]
MRSAYAFDPESSTSTTPHASTSTTGTFNANPRSAYVRPSAPALPPPLRNPHRSGLRAASDNRMVYVLAFEDDGHAHDVTWRAGRSHEGRVVGARGEERGTAVSAGMAQHRDDVEDAELEVAGLMEGMPTSMGGFKDHPMYVLERHLTQAQTLHPPPPHTPPSWSSRCFDGVGQPPPHSPAQPSSTNTMTPAAWSARTASSPRCAEPAFLNADEYHSPLASYSDFNDGGDPAVKIEEVHHHLLPHGAPSYMHHPMRQHAHHAHHAPHHQQHAHAHH